AGRGSKKCMELGVKRVNKANPKIVGSGNCIMCEDKEKENLNYLLSCKKLEKTWNEIENFMVKLIWTTAEDKLWQECRIQDLKKLLFGTLHKENIKARYIHKEETHIKDNKCYYVQYTEMLLPTSVERKMRKVIEWEENTGIRKALKEKVLDGAGKESMSISTGQIQSPLKNRDRNYEEKNLKIREVNNLVENSINIQITSSQYTSL
ncbi:46351_t:CDS:2, partial [Gigaspora margarita]